MLRELKTKDIFTMSKIVKKIGLKVDDTKDKTDRQVGAELIIKVFESIHLAENEINAFLADLSGMTVNEFEELPVEKTFEIINELKNIKGIVNFFKTASR